MGHLGHPRPTAHWLRNVADAEVAGRVGTSHCPGQSGQHRSCGTHGRGGRGYNFAREPLGISSNSCLCVFVLVTSVIMSHLA